MKKNAMVIIAAAVVAVAASVGVYLANFSSLQPADQNANATNSSGVELKLQSINALDSSHGLIGLLNLSQSFKINEPVFLQANFFNPNTEPHEYLVAIEIRGPNGISALSNLNATIGGSGHLSIEVYWKPDQVGDYELLLFQIPAENIGRGPVTSPVADIPLKVIV